MVRGVIPAALCDAARQAFADEIRPFGGYIYRQASAVPETNKFSDHGYMLNSILNIQDLDQTQFPRFRASALSVVTHPELHRHFATILGEPGKVVQTMYFEGNPRTWAHQDTYYLDSMDIGRMAGAWIAVEDIHPGAGRFYISRQSRNHSRRAFARVVHRPRDPPLQGVPSIPVARESPADPGAQRRARPLPEGPEPGAQPGHPAHRDKIPRSFPGDEESCHQAGYPLNRRR